MKKWFIILLFVFVSCYSLFGCSLTQDDEDTVFICSETITYEDMVNSLMSEENLSIVWQRNVVNNVIGTEPQWKYMVQTLSSEQFAGFVEKIYCLVDYKGREHIYHIFNESKVYRYYRANQDSEWSLYTGFNKNSAEVTIKDLLLEGMLDKHNMGAICEQSYFGEHTKKVNILEQKCRHLELKEDSDVHYYLTSKKLCLKWEDLSDDKLGGQVMEYKTNVTIAIPVI